MPKALFGVTVPMTANAFLPEQISDLVQSGWDVHLATSPSNETDSFRKLRHIPGLTLHAIEMKRQPSPLKDLQSLACWILLLRRIRPDIVVLSTPKASFLGMVASRIMKVPIRVYHVRGLRFEGIKGVQNRLSRLVERVSVRCSTIVLCDSQSLRTKMREEALLGERAAAVLASGSCCGVNTLHFHPPGERMRLELRQSLGIQANEIVVGFVGRLTIDKGVLDLFRAMKVLRQNHDHLLLFLTGPIEESQQITNFLQEIQEADWVRFLGPTSDPRSAYWAMDIFCLPSYREGFPIAPLEAQACGLPVITTDATGCIDSVEIDKTGIVTVPGDALGLARAISSLVEDPSKRHAMAHAARIRIQRKFEQKDVIRRHTNFYKTLVYNHYTD